MADDGIPQLTPVEQERWTAMQSAIDAAAHALTSPTADGDELQAAVNQIQAIDLDMGRVRDSLHIPDDAGDDAAALEAVLRRIPPGWGRWISCKAGWYQLIIRTDRELAAIDPDYTVHQIKEKWSVLEYYAHTTKGASVEVAMKAVTDRAREESEHTCELCGGPGNECSNFDYIKTLCVECAARTGYCTAPRPTTEH
ncbi:hypothetical protein [Cellulomonas sp. 73-145]|uniref:hypothetical protein n=1 Tax=Cellulomonas sp. 73-145 TaxID=1895739 RepID=UPI001AC66BF5|nr:hypothetical protein [Cellulomonas sp. 73-145]MBN9327919.1 hypothetical protein [Cellulomonas sp.]